MCDCINVQIKDGLNVLCYNHDLGLYFINVCKQIVFEYYTFSIPQALYLLVIVILVDIKDIYNICYIYPILDV